MAALDAEPGAVLACSARRIVDHRGRAWMVRRFPGRTGRVPGREAITRAIRTGTNAFGEPVAVLLDRDAAIRAGGFDADWKYCVDIDFWCRLLAHGDAVIQNAALCSFRVSPASWSTALGAAQADEFERFVTGAEGRFPGCRRPASRGAGDSPGEAARETARPFLPLAFPGSCRKLTDHTMRDTPMLTGILAGGLGTRLSEETEVKPKPMVEIGGRPILWHIMKSYSAAGFNEFVVALGYKGEVIKDYFLDYDHRAQQPDRPTCGTGEVDLHAPPAEDWTVHLVDTGPRHQHRRPHHAPGRATQGRAVHADLRRRRRRSWTSRRLLAVPPVARPAGDGHRGAAAGPVRRPAHSRATGSRGSPRSRRSARAGSTAASSCSNPERARLHQGRRDASSSANRSSASPRNGELVAYRHDGFWQCMDTLRDVRYLEALWAAGQGAVEDVVNERAAVLARSAACFVTGATGLVGGWLVRRLRRRRAPTSSCLVRDWVPQQRAGAHAVCSTRSRVVRGDVRDQALLERAPRRIRDRHGHPPRGPDHRGDRQPQPGLDLRDQHRRHVERCSRPAAAARGSSRSSSRRPTRRTATRQVLPYDESTPLQGRHPYDVSKSCADLIAQTYAHTYGLPVVITRCGNFYRRRRPELEPHRARARSARSCAASGRSSGPTAASSATTSTSRTAPPPTCCWPSARRRPGLKPGEAFNFSNEIQVTVLDARAASILAAMGSTLEPDVRNEASNEIRTAVPRRGARPDAAGLDAACSTSTTGLDRTIAWYRDFLTGRVSAMACRSCQYAELLPVLSLGSTPLANALLTPRATRRARAALPARPRVLPAVLAGADHRDRAAGTAVPRLPLLLVLLRHRTGDMRRRIAHRMIDQLGARRRAAWSSEVASNDGYLLQYYMARGVPVLGIEPARNIAAVARRAARHSDDRRVLRRGAWPQAATAKERAPTSSTRTTCWPTSRTSTASSQGFASLLKDRAARRDRGRPTSRPCSTTSSSTRSTTSTSATSR